MSTPTIVPARGRALHVSCRRCRSVRRWLSRPASRSLLGRDLRREQPLEETQTDARGAYRVRYAQPQFLNQGRGTADLVVKGLAADGSRARHLARSSSTHPPRRPSISTIPPDPGLSPTLFGAIRSPSSRCSLG